MISRVMINLAKSIYTHTPWQRIRSLYFQLFCALVRNRKMHASVEGIEYWLDLGEMIDVGILLDRYEPDIAAAIRKYCMPGFTVLDVGANVGAHTLRFAKTVGGSGKVFAFEPTDYAFQKLLRNVTLNSFTNVWPIRLVLADQNLAQQRIQFRSSWPTKGTPAIRESIVDFKKMDDWCADEKIGKIDLIKLDVDGNEHSVLMGAVSVLSRHRPLLFIEAWGLNFRHENINPFVLLDRLGYKFYNIVTEVQYESLAQLRESVSRTGELLDQSVNVIARHSA